MTNPLSTNPAPTSPTPAPWPANQQPSPPGALTYAIGFRAAATDGNGNVIRGSRNQTTIVTSWIVKPGCWAEVWRTYEKVSPTQDVSTGKLRIWLPYDTDTVQMTQSSAIAENIVLDGNGNLVLGDDGNPSGATIYEVEGPPHIYIDDLLNDLSHVECQATFQAG